MRIRPCAEDQALVGHVDGLAAHVEQDDPEGEPPHGRAHIGQGQPCRDEKDERHGRGPLAMPLVGPAPRTPGRQGADHAHQAEGTDDRVREMVGRRTERQDQGAPEDVEGSEHQEGDQAPNAQHPLVADERRHRRDEVGGTSVRFAWTGRSGRARQSIAANPSIGGGGEGVDASPSGDIADAAGNHAGQQQAHEDAQPVSYPPRVRVRSLPAAFAAYAIRPWVMRRTEQAGAERARRGAAVAIATASVMVTSAPSKGRCLDEHETAAADDVASGTTKSRARAQPTCVAVTTPPTTAGVIAKSAATASSKGLRVVDVGDAHPTGAGEKGEK